MNPFRLSSKNRLLQLLGTLGLAIFVIAPFAEVRAQATEYHEAPQLAERVGAGELPSLEERLPENPLVLEPVERIGQYGGEWNSVYTGGENLGFLRYQGYENLVRWTTDWEGVTPNVAESFEVNEDSTSYTFHLRRGMKWSDGEPFTAEDILFWYEDVMMNEELSPTGPFGWLTSGGEPATVGKVDDYTVVFRFAAPYGNFLQALATGSYFYPTSFPRHYLQQFHAKYNPEGIDQLVREAGAADWVALFLAKSGAAGVDEFYSTSEIPVINAWTFTTAPGEGAGVRATAERNPYYWKVDPEGNQLPYIDRIVYDQVADPEVALLRVLNGDVDMFFSESLFSNANKSVIIDNAERGDYRLYSTLPTYPNEAVIMFNLNHRDPVKREIFQNKDFRIGMSYAIDRQGVIDLIYVGQGEPYQAAPRPESAFYNEQLAKQYTEYNVELANEYLDKAFPEKDAQGFRLGPDGKRITIIFEIDAVMTNFVDMLELLEDYWADVGIEVNTRTSDRSLWQVRVKENGEQDAVIHTFGGGTGQTVLLDPRYWFPYNLNSMYAQAWAHWYNLPGDGGVSMEAEEPPAEVKRQMELYNQLKVTGNPDEQKELMNEILEIAADQFYTIGVSTQGDGYGVVKNTMHNVPEVMFNSWPYPTPAPLNPSQFFFDASQ